MVMSTFMDNKNQDSLSTSLIILSGFTLLSSPQVFTSSFLSAVVLECFVWLWSKLPCAEVSIMLRTDLSCAILNCLIRHLFMIEHHSQ